MNVLEEALRDLNEAIGATTIDDKIDKIANVTMKVVMAYAIEEFRIGREFGPGSPEHLEAIRSTKEVIRSCPLGTDALAHLFAAELAYRNLRNND